MTKKDYELIAAVVRHAANDAANQINEVAHRSIAYELATEFSLDNPNKFQTDKFLQLCGIED